MTNLTCDVCHSQKIASFLVKDCWEIARCENCGVAFVENIPTDDELKTYYKSEFFQDGQKTPKEGITLENNPTHKNAQKRLAAIAQMGFKEGRLLDVGCGTGVFLKAACSDYECTGLDISDFAVSFASANYGVHARQGSLLEVDLGHRSFDVVTMWDLIEHVRSPYQYSKRVSELIRQGGLLVVSTGNLESLMFKIQKTNWHLLIPPVHLYYFTPNSISLLLKHHGFEIIKIEHDGQYTNIGYMIDKLTRIQPRNRTLSILKSILNGSGLSKINIYVNLFDVMTVYAKRKE